MGVVGGAEAAGGARRTGGGGADSARTRGPVGGSGWAAGDGFRGAGENTDSNGATTVGSSGDSGASGAPTARPTGAVDGGGGPGGEGGGFGRLQAEKGGSGLDTGGNSDAGGPDDAVPDGDISRASAGAAEARSA
jgi:hypothetical protein